MECGNSIRKTRNKRDYHMAESVFAMRLVNLRSEIDGKKLGP